MLTNNNETTMLSVDEYMCMLRANRKYRVIASTDTHCTILSEEEGVTITLFRPLKFVILLQGC